MSFSHEQRAKFLQKFTFPFKNQLWHSTVVIHSLTLLDDIDRASLKHFHTIMFSWWWSPMNVCRSHKEDMHRPYMRTGKHFTEIRCTITSSEAKRPFFSKNSIKWSIERFLSRVSMLTRDIDIVNLSVCLSVRLSVRYVPVPDENGLTYCHSFFTIR